jgi:hypothetical protein
MSDEHVILVAFSVEGDTRTEAEATLRGALVPTLSSNGGPVDCWWVAEDDRQDGSDCDSAVFVTPGAQDEASRLLEREALTPAWNITNKGQTRFEVER